MKRYIRANDDVLSRIGMSSMDELEDFLYDAVDESFDDANIEPEGLLEYKESANEKELFKAFTDKLVDNLNGFKLGGFSVDTSFGTLSGNTDKIASIMVNALVKAIENGQYQEV